MDISKLNSMWHGESEKNVLGTMDAAVKYAKKAGFKNISLDLNDIPSIQRFS